MLSLLIFATAAAAQPRIAIPQTNIPAAAFPLCRDKGIATIEHREAAPVGVQKLNTLPNANEYLGVVRIDENGCQKPAIVNYDIGSAPRKQR